METYITKYCVREHTQVQKHQIRCTEPPPRNTNWLNYCTSCSILFLSNNAYRSHLDVHANQQQLRMFPGFLVSNLYFCLYCQRGYNDFGTLTVCMRNHKNQQYFVNQMLNCQICEYSTQYMDPFRKHMSKEHSIQFRQYVRFPFNQ